jgi:hypothetical protein
MYTYSKKSLTPENLEIQKRAAQLDAKIAKMELEILKEQHKLQEQHTGHVPPQKMKESGFMIGPNGERISFTDRRADRVEYTKEEILEAYSPAPGDDMEKIAEALPPVIVIGRNI